MKSDKGMAVLDILLYLINSEINILPLYSMIWQKQGSQEVHAVISEFLSFILGQVGKNMRKGDWLTIRKVR